MKNRIFNKKQFIVLISFIFLLIGVWAILAFLLKEELLTRFSLWSNLVFGTGSLITSILAIGISIISLRREEILRRQKIEDDANRFIQDNIEETEYLPLCLIAKAYDNHHKYTRKIYNSFNTLNAEIQEEVLRQLNYEYELINGDGWIDKGIELVRQFIKENDLGKDYLYSGAKYFHRAMKYSNEFYDESCEFSHIMPDVFNWNPKIFFKEDKVYQENVNFFDYVDSYINAKNNDPTLFNRYKEQRPLDVLSSIYEFSTCPEQELCYWIMEVVSSITIMMIREAKKQLDIDDIPQLSRGDAEILNFEDRYLDVLMDLYNLHLILKIKNNSLGNGNKR